MNKDLHLKCSICKIENSVYVVGSHTNMPTLLCKKCIRDRHEPPMYHIEAFEEVRNSGKYNMIMDVNEILKEPIMHDVTKDDYLAIINYLDRSNNG